MLFVPAPAATAVMYVSPRSWYWCGHRLVAVVVRLRCWDVVVEIDPAVLFFFLPGVGFWEVVATMRLELPPQARPTLVCWFGEGVQDGFVVGAMRTCFYMPAPSVAPLSRAGAPPAAAAAALLVFVCTYYEVCKYMTVVVMSRYLISPRPAPYSL